MADESTTALVPVQRRIIKWENGVPVLAAEPVLTKNHVQSLYFIAAAQPYEVTDPLDPDFGLYDGMTIAEVMVRKQLIAAARSGDDAKIEAAMDRLIGKPMARGENVNVNLGGSYETYLKGLAEKMKATQEAPNFVDAHIVEDHDAGSGSNGLFGDMA